MKNNVLRKELATVCSGYFLQLIDMIFLALTK